MTQVLPKPDITETSAPYWSALERGALMFQHCANCGQNQLPARHECTNCLGTDLGWVESEGRGTLVTWVDYHRAYDPAFKDQIPYNVAIVELEEGPRLVTNVMTTEPEALRIDQPVMFRPTKRFGQSITSFDPL
ncbi:OB-fold domain-containing protein [Pseudooceanicola sp.]|uniref:Zn-ribbon domain-containing OB-fold protein n=1 Tax=Pseudooceanicola sp. TaxID=1914328 RepID=UPI00262854F7|nr:OB-fold domain-containing protein [Pseudooceanicola sp.]MDF1856434.1 OB-fold domain-containing protein [Pseudooceanicola sp.]